MRASRPVLLETAKWANTLPMIADPSEAPSCRTVAPGMLAGHGLVNIDFRLGGAQKGSQSMPVHGALVVDAAPGR